MQHFNEFFFCLSAEVFILTDDYLIKCLCGDTSNGIGIFFAPVTNTGNERYTTLNLFKDIQALQAGETAIYGLYGKEDGLYGSDQIDRLAGLLGQQQLMYLDNCSHNIFIDRQQSFISALKKWL